MLSDERIRELATRIKNRYDFCEPVTLREDALMDAIRLAVAETAEACAALCARYESSFDWRGTYTHSPGMLAAAIREKAREKK